MENRPTSSHARIRGMLSSLDLNGGRRPAQSQQQFGSLFHGASTKSRLVKTPAYEDMLRLLECPVCYDTMVPPVNMCIYGHTICFNCIRKVKSCPLCRGQFGSVRNIFAEQVVAKCSISCRNVESGCKVVMHGDEIIGHEYFCKYRPVKCPQCEQYIEYHKFLEHIEVNDEIPMNDGPRCRSGYEISGIEDEGRMAWDVTWLKAFGYNFFGVLESDHNSWWFAVGCFGTPEDAQKFLGEIIVSHNTKGMVLRYRGPVYVLHAGMQEAVTKGECLSTTKTAIKALISDGGIDVSFKIYVRDTLTFGDLSFNSTFTLESPPSTESEFSIEEVNDSEFDLSSPENLTQGKTSAAIRVDVEKNPPNNGQGTSESAGNVVEASSTRVLAPAPSVEDEIRATAMRRRRSTEERNNQN